MCLIVLAYKAHPDLPLVLAANRDEIYQRPSRSAHFWPESPAVLAGQDVEQGGSWLGIHKNGKIAAITNYRDGLNEKTGINSRGLLVSNYLQAQASAVDYLQRSIADIRNYSGFNLILGDVAAMYFLSSREKQYRRLDAGIYGISNADLDSDWPKSNWAKQKLHDCLALDDADNHETILAFLANRDIPADAELPETGVGLEWERKLAPVFISANGYGTRASTVITIDKNGHVKFSERTFDSHGEEENFSSYSFMIEESD